MVVRAVLLTSVLIASEVDAAGAQSRGGPTLAGGIGVATASMSVGAASASAQGLTLHVAYGALELEWQPFAVANPDRSERFTSIYALLGPQVRLSPAIYVRPVVGVQFRHWSGANPVTSGDQGLALGAVAAYHVEFAGGWRLDPQLEWRYAVIEFQGNVHSQQVGVRLQLTRSR